ncbi:hypothetical protein [Paraburkholderia sp. RL17-347-BIC-D]|uniref:hypothetical protein n=1 Tax=Paraburkholderia sp. RL17-347-BIC-D TaxID=3031632 RepID=UPI0038BCC654
MQQTTRVLHLCLKDRHIRALQEQAHAVNFLWNHCNELSVKVWERELRFLSGYDFHLFTKGAGRAGLDLHLATIQAVAEEYAVRRRRACKIKPRWRKSAGVRRSLGWIPFKASAIRYRNKRLFFGKMALPLWDCYGLSNFELGAGNISEDARGRWYINISVTLKSQYGPRRFDATRSIGTRLGLKDIAGLSCFDTHRY